MIVSPLDDISIHDFEVHLCILNENKILGNSKNDLQTEISNGNMNIQMVFRQYESFYGESEPIFVKRSFRILRMEMVSPRYAYVNVSLKK